MRCCYSKTPHKTNNHKTKGSLIVNDYYLLSRTTVERIIDILESLDVSCISEFWGHLDILHKLKFEKCKIDISVTYEKVVQANGIELRRYENASLIKQINQPIISSID